MPNQSQKFLTDVGSPGEIDAIHLAAETLRSGALLRFRALGSSMIPAIWPGDLLTFEPVRFEQVNRGDVVLFLRGDKVSSLSCDEQRLTAHRAVDLDSCSLVTRGDALESCDPPVQPPDLLGRLLAIKPNRWRRLRGQVSLIARRLFATAPRRSAPTAIGAASR